MTGSGLQELLELPYASNNVSHIFTGMAVSRAVCGHLLIDTTLSTILLILLMLTHVQEIAQETTVHYESHTTTNGVHFEGEHQYTVITDQIEARPLYDNVISKHMNIDEVCSTDLFSRIDKCKHTKGRWEYYVDIIAMVTVYGNDRHPTKDPQNA